MHERRCEERGAVGQDASSPEKEDQASRLSRGVAHAIRNPLSILQMGVDFLHHRDDPDDRVKSVLKDMNDAIHRVDLIIQDLQNYSRTEALQLQPGNIRRVIEQALAAKQSEFESNRIEVRTQFSEVNTELPIDEGQIRQVIVNILENSAQAMPHGGELTVTTRDDEGLCIEIRDTGTGIDDQHFHRVFDPFFTTHTGENNAGLGLSSSQNVVHLHGGTMELKNLPGGGVCVVLKFATDKREDL